MAEAIVAPTTSMSSRFFCHRCSVEIDSLLPDYTCPRCSTGFIEELERASGGNAEANDADMDQDLSDIEYSTDPFDLPISFIRASSNPGRRRSARRGGSVDGTPTAGRSRRLRIRTQQQQQDSLPPQIDNLIQNIFFNLSGIGFGFSNGDQAPVRLFLGNPGDYVWGQNGLDSIVTQLLNQMDGTGPPPLPKKQIDELPTSMVTQKQVDTKLQCSVCWEDFVLEEPVKQLPCQHCFHAPCIVPWLELHGTCPICRQSLGEQSTVDANQDTVGPSLAALFRAANESTNGSRTSVGNNSRNNTSSEI